MKSEKSSEEYRYRSYIDIIFAIGCALCGIGLKAELGVPKFMEHGLMAMNILFLILFWINIIKMRRASEREEWNKVIEKLDKAIQKRIENDITGSFDLTDEELEEIAAQADKNPHKFSDKFLAWKEEFIKEFEGSGENQE